MSISDIYRASLPIPAVDNNRPSQGTRGPDPKSDEFQKVLNQELSFSKHAESRIRSREIPWDQALEGRISRGLDSASQKGSRETLILADNVAVIANVESRTIITAMDKTQMKERIFTNIDSTVLV